MTASDRPIRVAHVVTIYRGVVGILEPKLVALDRHPDLDICCVTAPRPDDLELPQPKVRHLSCPMSRRIVPAQDLASVRALARIFAREDFDIVHSHSAKAGMLAALARRLAPVPFLVHTYHGLPFFDGQSRILKRAYESLEKVACRHRDFCLSQNHRDLPAIARLMRSEDLVGYEGNGVDIEATVRRAQETAEAAARYFPPGGLKISLVSRLEPVKKVDDFLRVLHRLISAGHDIGAVIAGYGPDRGDLEDSARRLGISERVRFLGWYPDVAGLLAASDIVMLTSQKEGIPRSLIEAMALARPVVATDALGTQELVVDGVTGYLCPLGDVEALARRVAALADDPRKQRVLGENGYRRVVEHFDDLKIADRLASLYRRVVAGQRGRDLAASLAMPMAPRALRHRAPRPRMIPAKGGAEGMDIRELHEPGDEELASVAGLHHVAFSGFFLDQLGTPFLREYYRNLHEYPMSIFLVARSDHRIIGFATGFQDPDRFYRRMKAQWRRFLWPLLRGLLRRPNLLRAAIANVRRVRDAGQRLRRPAEPTTTVELSSLAVSPAHPSRGLGHALLEAFTEHARDHGVARIVLTTDRDDNDRVVRFYQSAGFVVVAQLEPRSGRVLLRLQKSLEAEEPR